jgi:DNA segregation ATPase FtsK/SpoIIIE, S-DNA-T family
LAKATETKPRLMGLSVGRAAREGVLWIGFALALILLWALASYDPSDPGFSSTGSGRGISNAAGPAGAWVSSFLYVLFGHPAYLFPVLLAGAGWLALKSRDESGLPSGRVLGLRIGGFIVTLAASCGLATLHFSGNGLPETAGGIVGQLAGFGLQSMLSFLGATLLLLALWLAGVSLFSGMSWLAVMDRVGRATISTVAAGQRAVDLLRDRIAGRKAAQARQESVERKKQSVVRKAPPRIEPVIAPAEKSERVEKERQVPLFGTPAPGEIPPLGLLDEAPPRVGGYSDEALEAMSRLVELKLRDFGVEAQVVSVLPGPVVTRFELQPAPGVKVSKISSLAKDLARSLSVISVRIVEVIPNKPYVGIEIPNEAREVVRLKDIIASAAFQDSKSPVTLALGKDIGGEPMTADVSRMPHLLVAGTTGSGKSVGVNAMLLSILYKATPDEVRLILVDPKMRAGRREAGHADRRSAVAGRFGPRGPGAHPAAGNRGGDRRIRRHDDDRRQEGGNPDRPGGAEGAGGRHPPDPGDPAAVGGRHHRPDQGEHSHPDQLPGLLEDRLAHDPRPGRRRAVARPRRHALPAAGHRRAGARARRVRERRRGAPGGNPESA